MASFLSSWSTDYQSEADGLPVQPIFLITLIWIEKESTYAAVTIEQLLTGHIMPVKRSHDLIMIQILLHCLIPKRNH